MCLCYFSCHRILIIFYIIFVSYNHILISLCLNAVNDHCHVAPCYLTGLSGFKWVRVLFSQINKRKGINTFSFHFRQKNGFERDLWTRFSSKLNQFFDKRGLDITIIYWDECNWSDKIAKSFSPKIFKEMTSVNTETKLSTNKK